MKALLTFALLCFAAAPASADLILSEVFYDYPGADDTYEWVEIVNTGTLSVDLTGYILAWGGTDYGYGQLVLDGMVSGCAMYMVGGPGSDAGNGDPGFDQAVDFAPDIQNSGSAADGVALFAPGADVLTDTPIDAVVYGPVNSNGLIDETGLPAAPEVGDAPAGSSIARVSLAGDWVILDAPSPWNENFTYTCVGVVPTAPRSWGALKSQYR